jgi:hypothetical protein
MSKKRLHHNRVREKSTIKRLPNKGARSQRRRLEGEDRMRRLNEFIELANLVPPTHQLKDLDEFIKGGREQRDSEDEYSLWIRKYKFLLMYLEDFPQEFREYVIGDSIGSLEQINLNNLADGKNTKHFTEIYGALSRYDQVREARDKLRTLIRLSKGPGGRSFFSFYIMNRINVYAYLDISKDGTVEISYDSFAETIEGLNATRIRECKDCQRIFWAKRKDQSCCSRDCANRYHVRQHREKYASDPIAHKMSRLDREQKRNSKKRR